MLTAEQLHVALGGQEVIGQLSVAFDAGKLTAIVGPNGSGKTTLLRALSGELTPERGRVEFDGQDLSTWESRDLARRRAFLPQENRLGFAFRVEEVVMMGRTPHIERAETPEDVRHVREALQQVGLQDFARRLYTTLSGGEKQRVQLARVLAQIETGGPGRMLLLDEPTNNLDLASQHHVLKLARKLARDGVTVLAVLHDLNLALQYADEALVLECGQSAASGPVVEALDPAIVSQVFRLPCKRVDIEGRPLLLFNHE